MMPEALNSAFTHTLEPVATESAVSCPCCGVRVYVVNIEGLCMRECYQHGLVGVAAHRAGLADD